MILRTFATRRLDGRDDQCYVGGMGHDAGLSGPPCET